MGLCFQGENEGPGMEDAHATRARLQGLGAPVSHVQNLEPQAGGGHSWTPSCPCPCIQLPATFPRSETGLKEMSVSWRELLSLPLHSSFMGLAQRFVLVKKPNWSLPSFQEWAEKAAPVEAKQTGPIRGLLGVQRRSVICLPGSSEPQGFGSTPLSLLIFLRFIETSPRTEHYTHLTKPPLLPAHHKHSFACVCMHTYTHPVSGVMGEVRGKLLPSGLVNLGGMLATTKSIIFPILLSPANLH